VSGWEGRDADVVGVVDNGVRIIKELHDVAGRETQLVRRWGVNGICRCLKMCWTRKELILGASSDV